MSTMGDYKWLKDWNPTQTYQSCRFRVFGHASWWHGLPLPSPPLLIYLYSGEWAVYNLEHFSRFLPNFAHFFLINVNSKSRSLSSQLFLSTFLPNFSVGLFFQIYVYFWHFIDIFGAHMAARWKSLSMFFLLPNLARFITPVLETKYKSSLH